jgi:uncharacterized cupin superfamily protein
MAGYSVKRIDDMEAIASGSFRRARAELGITAFGLQVIDMPPNATGYPEHDHGHDGQEEVYVALRGWADVEIDGERLRLDNETMVSVKSDVKRKLFPGDEGLRVLVIGGVPGQAFAPVPLTELGGPDPFSG